MSFIQDQNFGKIVNFDELRRIMRRVYDSIVPEFNLLKTLQILSESLHDSPSHMVAAGASMLAYQMLVVAGEKDLAEELKGNLFTLGWTEEHCGTDLLSIRTQATPISADPNERMYHISGHKWMINNSYHADYHCVLAKLDPTQNGPRSLSLFLVPRSSTKNWQRLDTHVLNNMVLTEFDIEGEGRLIGKRGQGLQIVQQMANAARYQCSYVGMRMVREAIPETINWLSSKHIFGNNPINFSNVFKQLYQLALQTATVEFTYYRAHALNTRGGLLQFNGTMLKSFMLLRVNEMLLQNLLVAGSKGFTKMSLIGRDLIDSLVLPVFDGHYTLNTFMTAKHAERYLQAERPEDPAERIAYLRDHLYRAEPHGELESETREGRQPDFFNYAQYLEQLRLPIALPAQQMVEQVQALINEMNAQASISSDPDFKYKVGDLVHWMESVMAASEMWAVTRYNHYSNAIVLQYNGFVNAFNKIISDNAFETPYLEPMKMEPMIESISDAGRFLLELCDVEAKVKCMVPATASGD